MANDSFFNINSFRSRLKGGAKPNLFKVMIFPETAATIDGNDVVTGEQSQFSLLCRSAAIPAYSVGVIEVPYRGRRIKLPGDRTYAEWTVTVINDAGQTMRKYFDNWVKYINNPNGEQSIRGDRDSDREDDYRATIVIGHLRTDGTISRQYALQEAFPTDVSAIDLSYDTTDAIQEFTVTFQYHHLSVGATTETGDAPAPQDLSVNIENTNK